MFRTYGKAITATVAAALMVAYGAFSGDQHVDPDEWIQIGIALVTAAGVYLIPLAPRYTWTKTAVAALLAVLQALTTVIIGGVDPGEWMALALAAATVLGVSVTPAVSDNGVGSRGNITAN
jgi:hypothetical protein